MAETNNNNIITKETKISFDFDKIKKTLIDYLKDQDTYNDYQFEASNLSVLLDVLSYNTQMNAMTAHLALNELYLSSAVARPNIVLLARQLGYLPKSVVGAEAVLSMIVTPTLSAATFQNQTFTLPKGTLFSGGDYSWYTTESHTVTISGDRKYYLGNVRIKEGKRKTFRFYYDSHVPYQKFRIPDVDVDISSLEVSVFPIETSDSFDVYERFETFTQIESPDSRLFFLHESPTGKYEIYFPDKTDLGMTPTHGSVIELTYYYSAGSAANDIGRYRLSETFSQHSCEITEQTKSEGGANKESADSIKANAPHFFQAQNRGVTTQDYVALIRQNHPSIETISCWGGETNNPPEYGRIYFAFKPKEGKILSEKEKEKVINKTLKNRRVVTINPVIIDPDYTGISLSVQCVYDPSLTNKQKAELEQKIKGTIDRYSSIHLSMFDSSFRFSQLTSMIDKCDVSIINTSMSVLVYKEANFFGLSALTVELPELYFPIAFHRFFSDGTQYLSTSPIYINRKRHYIKDVNPQKYSAGKRQLQLVHFEYVNGRNTEVVSLDDVGYIDLSKNSIKIKGFRPDSTSAKVNLYFKPINNNIFVSKTQLLLLNSNDNVNVEVVSDTNTQLRQNLVDDDYAHIF